MHFLLYLWSPLMHLISSALKETINTIKNAFNKGECALIAYQDDKAIGMLRFQIEETELYFYRLSVLKRNIPIALSS